MLRGTPPPGTDLVGYGTLIRFILDRSLHHLRGDFIEVGAWLGGGTFKLAQLASRCGKTVWVVDIFDPDFDVTVNLKGTRMCESYRAKLAGKSQEEIFYRINKNHLPHLHVLKEDSRALRLPPDVRFCFGFIDGNHDPLWVESDFRLVWERLVPGGAVGLHDYGGDLPQVTSKIDELILIHRKGIGEVFLVPQKWLILLTKAADLGIEP